MRRSLANLLLFLICLGAALPLVTVLQTGVPACCRRDGSHHCVTGSHGPDGFRAAAGACPYRRLVATSTKVAALPITRDARFELMSYCVASATNVVHLSSSTFDGTPKRGPPLA